MMVTESPAAEAVFGDSQQAEYVLFTTTSQNKSEADGGSWRIMLGDADGEILLDVQESEVEFVGDRLDLLSVIRGLEALDEPSTVTLFTSSRYVQRGLRFGLDTWRRAAWCWERFGRMVPIKNHDLWQRLDHALQYHRLECRYWRFNGKTQQRDDHIDGGEPHAA